MDVYKAVSQISGPGVQQQQQQQPAYMKSLVSGADAEKAYLAFLGFKDAMKASQVSTAGSTATTPSGDAIGKAAEMFFTASYSFLKSVDWLSPIYFKPLPGVLAQASLKAINKALVMGSDMDRNLLKAVAEAYHKALGNVDAKGVTSAADDEALNAALGRVIASVPASKVMDVYNSFSAIVGSQIPSNMLSLADPVAANVVAKAFYEFKDVVKASR